MSYSDQLKSPQWQRMRLEIMQRDNFQCQRCYDTEATLNVHHLNYERGKSPWEYSAENLITLCENCHSIQHGQIAKIREQAKNPEFLDTLAEIADCGARHLPDFEALVMVINYDYGKTLSQSVLESKRAFAYRLKNSIDFFITELEEKLDKIEP